MGYKYRNGSTPDHVNSTDSTSTPTPVLAARDATAVKKPDPVLDKLTAREQDSSTRYNRAANGFYQDGEKRNNPNFDGDGWKDVGKALTDLSSATDEEKDKSAMGRDLLAKTANKNIADKAALNAYKKNKQ